MRFSNISITIVIIIHSKAGKPNCLRDSKKRFESYCQGPSKLFELRHTETGRFSYANQ